MNLKIPLFLITFAVITSASAFVSLINHNFIYLTYIIIFAFLYLYNIGGKKRFNLAYFIFVFLCSISLFVNDIDPVFSAYYRLLFFILITCLIGPSITSKFLGHFRIRLFFLLNKSLICLSALSFLFLITGIYSGNSVRGQYDNRPDFTGLFNHSMILGPISGLSIITLSYYLMGQNSNQKKYFYVVLLILCILSLITAGSRGAIVGTIIGLIFLFYKKIKNNIFRSSRNILIIMFLAFSTFSIWSDYSVFLISKFNSGSEVNNIIFSREVKWLFRIEEFIKSPFFGVGFATIDPNSLEIFDRHTGTIEPGSSWLSILSMTGLTGFLAFIVMLFRLYKKRTNSKFYSYLIAYLSFFLIHFVFEGYVLSSGSLLFFCFWLLLGLLFTFKKHPEFLTNNKIIKDWR